MIWFYDSVFIIRSEDARGTSVTGSTIFSGSAAGFSSAERRIRLASRPMLSKS